MNLEVLERIYQMQEQLDGRMARIERLLVDVHQRLYGEEVEEEEDRMVSTAEMAAILGMTEAAFIHWYQRHPSLYGLHGNKGRHLRWPVRAVKSWFERRGY